MGDQHSIAITTVTMARSATGSTRMDSVGLGTECTDASGGKLALDSPDNLPDNDATSIFGSIVAVDVAVGVDVMVGVGVAVNVGEGMGVGVGVDKSRRVSPN